MIGPKPKIGSLAIRPARACNCGCELPDRIELVHPATGGVFSAADPAIVDRMIADLTRFREELWGPPPAPAPEGGAPDGGL